jgi:hypothetical protein
MTSKGDLLGVVAVTSPVLNRLRVRAIFKPLHPKYIRPSMSTRTRWWRFQIIITLFVFVLIVAIGINYYTFGFSGFNKENAVSIFGSVIQGMSALLSVAIAVVIFRIQSLENRNLSLEQSTLNYVFNITRWTYPQWGLSVEDDIKSGRITTRYSSIFNTSAEERTLQQTRLLETLDRLHSTEQTIRRIRKDIPSSVLFLVLPILFSFLLLMVSDTLNVEYIFFFVSFVVIMSATGTALLIRLVLDSIS